jgi:hypothetical protein
MTETSQEILRAIDSFTNDYEDHIRAWPWWKTLYYKLWHWGLKSRWQGFGYEFMSRWQTLTQGYAEREVWNFETYAAQWMLIRLKALRQISHGMPPDIILKIDPTYKFGTTPSSKQTWQAASDLWDSYLDDMIYFLQTAARPIDEALPWWKDKRYRRGKFLLFRYWEHLWD